MNAKVGAIYQKLDNLNINPVAIVAIVTPNWKIYGVPGYIITECQLLAEPTPNQVNYTQGNP